MKYAVRTDKTSSAGDENPPFHNDEYYNTEPKKRLFTRGNYCSIPLIADLYKLKCPFTDFLQSNFSLTKTLPRSPIFLQSSLSRARSSIFSASPRTSRSGTRNPELPSSNASGIPPLLVPKTGT